MNASVPACGGKCRRGLASVGWAFCLAAGFSAPAEPLRIYFPPVPPPLGAPRAPAAEASTVSPAPPALADYVDEPFYAPLGARFARGEIGDDLAFRLDTYRQDRAALRAELQARLYTARNLDSSDRERAFRDFAREQTPRIAVLEKEAEKLRVALSQHGGGLAEYSRWIRALAGPPALSPTPALRLELIRMARFFWRGFSPAQRRLLGGIAVRLAPEQAEARDADSLLAFSPETARLRLPAELPPELAARVSEYRRQRGRLETELLAALFPAKPYGSEVARAVALETLAEAQESRLAGLETAAEVIRLGLAALSDPARPPELPSLPPDLAATLAAYRADKQALNRALLARRDEVIAADPKADAAVLADRIRQAVSEFTRRNSARFAALDRRRDAIRSRLAALPGGGSDSADALLADFSASLRRLQTYWDYRDYQAAVLQPDLSPEQRRLLFGAAVEELALPLPGGESGPATP